MKKSKTKPTSLKSQKSFITGSWAYGLPNADSDIDLVVLVTEKELQQLLANQDGGKVAHEEDYISAGGTPMRFGKMNIIACTHSKQFEIWRRGTFLLKAQKPVNREFAIEFMRELREEAGYCVPRPIAHFEHDDESDIAF